MLNFNKFFGAPKEEPPVETPEEAKAPAEEEAAPSETAADRSEKNTLDLCDTLIARYKESDAFNIFTEPKNWLYNLMEK